VSERGRGEVSFDWIRRIACLAGFVFVAFIKESGTWTVPIAFLSMCGAVFPAAEFRALLKGWRTRNGE
jgi:hypothetical protein